MSGVKRSVLLEEYENGGFGLVAWKNTEKDRMGLANEEDVIEAVREWINESRSQGNGSKTGDKLPNGMPSSNPANEDEKFKEYDRFCEEFKGDFQTHEKTLTNFLLWKILKKFEVLI